MYIFLKIHFYEFNIKLIMVVLSEKNLESMNRYLINAFIFVFCFAIY